MSGRALLGRLGRLRGASDLRFGLELAERLHLDLIRHVHELSWGNKQKLGVALARLRAMAL
jgi:ABC-type multidrug transport system ATPase subunit